MRRQHSVHEYRESYTVVRAGSFFLYYVFFFLVLTFHHYDKHKKKKKREKENRCYISSISHNAE